MYPNSSFGFSRPRRRNEELKAKATVEDLSSHLDALHGILVRHTLV